MRAVQGDLPGEGHHACMPQLDFRAAAPPRACIKEEEPVRLHPLRQAVRREEHDRAGRRQARRQALDVPAVAPAALDVDPDVRRLPRHHHERAEVRSLAGVPERPRPRTTDDYLRERERSQEVTTSPSRAPENRRAPCGPPASRCAAPASWCRACRRCGPTSNSFATVSGVQTMFSCLQRVGEIDSRAARRSCAPNSPASVGPARSPSFADSVWQATQARNTSRAVIAGIGGQRIARRARLRRADGLAGLRIPAPDRASAPPVSRVAAVRHERDRPDRQPRPDQRAGERCASCDRSG